MSRIGEIEHVVVLMLENRSFDHMLGSLPGVEGVVSSEGNPRTDLVNHVDPTDPSSPAYSPKLGAQFATPKSQQTAGGRYGGPSHSFPAATEQRFGTQTVEVSGSPTSPYNGAAPHTTPACNSGFVASFVKELERTYRGNGTSLEEQQRKAQEAGEADPVEEVMEVFTADQLPAIHALAQEFCVCDHWHSEVPGPTEPNRLFMHAATSDGLTYNPWQFDVLSIPTIYDRIDAAGRDWAMYGFDLFDSSNFDSLKGRPNAKRTWQEFLLHASGGELPFYSFICPRYADAKEGRANSQHAPHDVRYGDQLIADVYRALRNSPLWNKLLLVVTYDEHGGFYDHVEPPKAVKPDPAVSPNAFMREEARRYHRTYLTSPSYDFDFEQLGFRVPTILASPWIERGTVDSTTYSHTSILRFLEESLKLSPLSARDAAAASFAPRLSRTHARTDCPLELPGPALPASDPELYMQEPPSPKQEEWARRYTTKLSGHSDTGMRTERCFPTNESLSRYIELRNRCDAWACGEDWKAARFEVHPDVKGHWRWRLRDGSGDILAASTDAYADREQAIRALERARFLAHQLGDPVSLDSEGDSESAG